MDFTGQTVLVTGATRGICKQIADDFEKLGARLLLTGTDKSQIESLRKKYSAKGRRTYYCVDFTNTQSTEAFLKELRKNKKIDVCINNAGINRINPIDETLPEDWDDMLSVNLTAPYLIIREVSRIMKKNRYGRIVNISSIFGVISKAKRSLYSATKFGLRGLTVASAIELARYNVLVNTVSPGFVLTDLTRKNLSKVEMKELASQIPVGRFADPQEISQIVVFISSKLNSYLTGQNIIIDGGFINV